MKSIFSNEIFAREDAAGLGGVMRPNWVKPIVLVRPQQPIPNAAWGQQPQAAPLAGSKGTPILLRQLEQPSARMGGIIDDAKDLLTDLPEEVAGSFQKRLDDCIKLLTTGDITGAAACGQKIYDEIQAIRKGSEVKDDTKPAPKPRPTTSEIPWIPLAIGVAGVGVLIFILAKKG